MNRVRCRAQSLSFYIHNQIVDMKIMRWIQKIQKKIEDLQQIEHISSSIRLVFIGSLVSV